MASPLPDDLEAETPEQVRARIAAAGGLPDDLEGEQTPSAKPAPTPFVPERGSGLRAAGLGFLAPLSDLAAKVLPGEPVYRESAPQVGPKETALTQTVGMVPLGKPAVNVGAALALHALKSAGGAAPGVSRALASIPILGQAAPPAGPGATLTPQAMEQLRAMGEDVSAEAATPDLVDEYRAQRERSKVREQAGKEQNPLAALGGKAGGLGLTLLAPLPKFAGGDSLLSKAVAGAGTGAGYGLLGGLTEGNADLTRGEVGKAAGEGILGATIGGLLGGTLPVLGEGFRRMARGFVRPDAEAQALQQAGVQGLTIGQMDPKSALGSAESALQSTPGFGPAIKAQREVAQDSFRVAALNKARPAGMPELPQGTPVPEAMGALQEGFSKAYAGVDAMPVPTKTADRLLLTVTDPKVRIATRATTSAADEAEKFVQDQMTILPSEGTETTVGVLRELRSRFRDEIRDRLSGDPSKHDRSVAAILKKAEESLTSGIEEALPPDAAKALRATDKQYSEYKTLEDAVFKAKDPVTGMGAFTPARLETSVQQASQSVPEYVSGGGGPLRLLAAQSKRAFQDVAPTGWGAQLAGNPLIRPIAAPMVYFANRPGVKPFALGETSAQQSMRALDDFLSRYIQGPTTYPASSAIIEALANRRRMQTQETP